MKLSAALRAGIERVPKQNHSVFFGWQDAQVVSACAVGTAYIGAGARPRERVFPPPVNWVERQMEQMVVSPVTKACGTVRLIMQDLNDESRWTRERIAEWLESLGF